MSETGRIVIAGATGQVGKPLCARLIAEGYSVVVLTRRPRVAAGDVPGAEDYLAWEPGVVGPWASAVDGAAAVVNLAGAPFFRRWSRGDFDRVVTGGRILGNRCLAEAVTAASTRPGVFVSASAVGYYGFTGVGDPDEIVTEHTPPGIDHWANGVRAWEAEAARVVQAGVRTAFLRTGIVLAADEGMAVRMAPQFRRGFGAVIGSGSQWLPWIHVDDVVGLYHLALTDDRVDGGLNVAALNPVRYRDYAEAMAAIAGRPVRLTVPGAAMRLALGDVADSVLHNRRMIPARALELGYEFSFADLSAALRDVLGSGAA